VNTPEPPENAGVPKDFRRLQGNELVSAGDFVADERLGLELWEGPNGFRADSFVKAIYRREKSQPNVFKKIGMDTPMRPGAQGTKAR
jgi:hypothetical protein